MDNKIKKQAIRRLKIVAGQVRGLEKMIAGDRYCIPVIYQSLAVKEALSGFEDFILENHLATHAAAQMKGGRSKKAIAEILKVYKLTKRK